MTRRARPGVPTPGMLARRVVAVGKRLERAYGQRRWEPYDGPVEELVLTILSQNTSNVNSRVAYEALLRRFENWDKVADAAAEDITDAIRSGGLAEQKTATIQRALHQLRQDFGSINLDILAAWPIERSMDYLTTISGIGPKTAACVLMFSLGLPVLPVDTHIHRLAIRLGMVHPQATAIRTQEILQKACPSHLVYMFHMLLIAHGREVCKAQRPQCSICVLKDLCPFYIYGTCCR